jgi:hypothetical protein
VSSRLGNPEPLFSKGTALSEHAQLSMTPGEVGASEYSGRVGLIEALVVPRIAKGC